MEAQLRSGRPGPAVVALAGNPRAGSRPLLAEVGAPVPSPEPVR